MKKQKRKETMIKGGLLGTVLAVAAGLFLISKPGKKFRHDVKHHVAKFYKHLSPQLKKIRQMGEREFKDFVKGALKTYSAAHKLTRAEEKAIGQEIQKTWKQLKKHVR